MYQKDKPRFDVKWTVHMVLAWVVLYTLLFLLWVFVYNEYLSIGNLKGSFFVFIFALIPSLILGLLHYLSNNLHRLNYPLFITPENVYVQYCNARIFLALIGYFIVLFFVTLFHNETKKVLLHPNEGILLFIILFLMLKAGLAWFIYKSFQNKK